MNWILFGFKSAGKTYFGKRVGLPFLDTDQLIEKRENKSIRDLILQKGEVHFRSVEKEIILNLNVSGHVIALGGGSVLDLQNLAHLQNLGTLIYLDLPKEKIKQRLLISPLPTFLDPKDPEGSFEKMYCTRKLIYEKIPSYTIHLKEKSDQEVLKELWQIINSDKSFESPLGENLMAKPSEL